MECTTPATPRTSQPSAVPDSLADPADTECMGQQLAVQLSDAGAQAVVSWNVTDDVVLAHVVARTLGTPLWRADDVEGVVELTRALREGVSVVLVAEAVRQPMALAGLTGIVSHYGGRVVAVATARASTFLRDEAPENVQVVTAEQQQ